jgi:hypothetical protein
MTPERPVKSRPRSTASPVNAQEPGAREMEAARELARQVAAWLRPRLEEIDRKLDSLMEKIDTIDAERRAGAVSRARTWAEVIRHLDATGEPEFRGCLGDDVPPAVVRVPWAARDWLAGATWWLNVAVVIQAFHDMVGARPIIFYEPPGQADGEQP